MKKIAFFVEGRTEVEFVTKLMTEMLNRNSFQITSIEFTGPIESRNLTLIRANNPTGSVTHYIMIYCCRGDGAVKSDILERYQNLVAQSYTAILGIRDVYPIPDLPNLRKYIKYGLPDNLPIPIDIILAVMEIESWFIAEETHYSRICSSLNHTVASRLLGIDVSSNSTESLLNPANDLHRVYQQAGRAYNKSKKTIQRTVDAIDYANLYISVRSRNQSLNELLTCLDSIL